MLALSILYKRAVEVVVCHRSNGWAFSIHHATEELARQASTNVKFLWAMHPLVDCYFVLQQFPQTFYGMASLY